MHLIVPLVVLLSFSGAAIAEAPTTDVIERSGSLNDVFPAEQVAKLADVISPDEIVRWKLFVPASEVPHGVVVFVSPSASGAPQPGWTDILSKRNLIWIGAENFGNEKLSAQRVLVALMGLASVQKDFNVDGERIYIAGMSGGGRIASQTITKFPTLFTGALYIVGVDFWTKSDTPLLEHIRANRYVFLTGDGDFNRRETKRVYRKYQAAGANRALLIDLADFGHGYPDPQHLDRALEFLDHEK